ncbi:hypothetical protein IEQ34_008809 [Dendrobium chrysotoxum]|uniref:Uncharacterized protein n=1 Tax=Dendrobium chrysotoxum TaxID=161865 RepID=A0AAV7GHK6_DENCH|nr:hypothetical protein IEQ34_008809 [Dendrobium chrysotoxum]
MQTRCHKYVTTMGINTEWGLLMASISEDSGEQTPLQVRLNGVATLIGIVGLSVAVFFTGHTQNLDGSVQFVKGHTSVKDAIDGAVKILTVAVTIMDVVVPEGLPLAVTLILAYSMKKMLANKVLMTVVEAHVSNIPIKPLVQHINLLAAIRPKKRLLILNVFISSQSSLLIGDFLSPNTQIYDIVEELLLAWHLKGLDAICSLTQNFTLK